MTLSQLRAFALVARMGSMRAAAAALGISEPAVSSAVAALRNDLGDALVVRSGGGIALTAGGRRLAAHADEIVGLADLARREVAAAGTVGEVLRVGVTATFEEHAATGLINAFTKRMPATSVEVVPVTPERMTEVLLHRLVDVALGLPPARAVDGVVDVVPFLRYQRVLVAAADSRLGRVSATIPLPRGELIRERWFTGPAGVEELSAEGRWLIGSGMLPDLVPLGSEAEVRERVLAGEGLGLLLAHVVRDDLRRQTVVRLPVAGTPVHGLWCASTLGRGRAVPGARALQRFVTTPDATAASVAPTGAPRGARALPPVHVTLWS